MSPELEQEFQAAVSLAAANVLGGDSVRASIERYLRPLFERGAADAERRTAPVVVMCGSVRFRSTWASEMARLTDEGNIVLTVGRMLPKATGEFDPAHKERLDALHKRKIDLADWVWVLDVGGYVGDSTKSEIEYAGKIGRPVRYLSQEFPDFVEPLDEFAAAKADAERWKHIEANHFRAHSPHMDGTFGWAFRGPLLGRFKTAAEAIDAARAK